MDPDKAVEIITICLPDSDSFDPLCLLHLAEQVQYGRFISGHLQLASASRVDQFVLGIFAACCVDRLSLEAGEAWKKVTSTLLKRTETGCLVGQSYT